MIKTTIYTNKDGEDFTLTNIGHVIEFKIINGNNCFYFVDSEDLDEFIELLQEAKKEIWKND